MRISTLAISAPTLVAAAAQLTAPVCTDASYAWTTNSLGQNPCVVAAYLEAVCSGDGSFSIPPIGRGQHYTGPNGESTDAADAHDVCKCNTVVYSLLAACAACQGGTWMQWSFWSLNCTTVLPDGVYSKNIPDGTLVPHWAYLPVSQTDLWSNVSAHQASQESSPESSASSSATLTALGSLNTPTTSPNALPSSSPSSGTCHSFSVIIVYAIVGAFAFNTLFAP